MEWLIIPAIVAGIVLGIVGIWRLKTTEWDTAWLILCIGAFLLLLSLIFCPISYYSSRSSALGAEAYFEQNILPHVVVESTDYVEVQGSEAGIWQAGGYNVSSYNIYLRTTRYWDSVPIIGSCVYTPPANLQYVHISRH